MALYSAQAYIHIANIDEYIHSFTYGLATGTKIRKFTSSAGMLMTDEFSVGKARL